MSACYTSRERVSARLLGKIAPISGRTTSVVAVALSLALPHPAVAQRPDMSGTWELTAPPSPPTFERSRSGVPRPCDPDEAQIGMLRLYAGPAKRLTIKQSEQTLLMGTETGSPFTFYPDGREAKLPGTLEVVYRARWTTDGALVIEWKLFRGTMVESYVLTGGQPLLRVDQTIAHPALSQPARQRLSYRRIAEPLEQSVPAARQSPPASGLVADTTFRPVIERPAYAMGMGPVVLVDEAHSNAHTATGRYLPFAELLRRDGYIVKSCAERLTAEVLRAGRVLVIASAQEPLTRDEVTAIHDWVAKGGSLLLITDHPPHVEAAMDVGRAFGIRFRNGGAADLKTGGLLTFRRSDATLKDHPVARGIDEVVTFAGSSFQIDTDGQPLLMFGPQVCSDRLGPNPVPLEGHLQGAVLPFGAGRVAVFAEAAMFSAQVTGPNRAPMGMNAPIAKQNVQFLLNLMHWLTGLM